MCDFLSFAVPVKGELKLYVGKTQASHNSMAVLNGIKETEYCECEWKDDTQISLSVRCQDEKNKERLTKAILGKWTRAEIDREVAKIYLERGNITDIHVTKENQDLFKDIEKVSGYVYVHSGATLTVPELAECGYVDVHSGATLTAPELAECGSVNVNEGGKLITPKLNEKTK